MGPRDSFKLVQKRDKEFPRFFQISAKTKHKGFLRFFQITLKTRARKGPWDSVKLVQTIDTRVPRDSFKLGTSKTRRWRPPRFFQTIYLKKTKGFSRLFQITSKIKYKVSLRFFLTIYFKNKTQEILEILSNNFKNKTHGVLEIFSNYLKNNTRKPRDSFKLCTSKTKHEGLEKFL